MHPLACKLSSIVI